MTASQVNSSAYSSSSSTIATAAQNLILNPVPKLIRRTFVDLLAAYMLGPITRMVVFGLLLFYFSAAQTIQWFVVDLICRFWAVPIHAALSDIAYVQGIKYTEQHNYKAANVYYAYITLFRLSWWLVLAVGGSFAVPYFLRAFGVREKEPQLALMVFFYSSLVNYSQETETRRLYALNHLIGAQTMAAIVVSVVEILAFLLCGVFAYSFGTRLSFYTVFGIELVVKTVPNLLVLLSQINGLKQYLLSQMQLSLNLKYAFPLKKDIVYFILLKFLENLLFYADECLLLGLAYLLAQRAPINNETLQSLQALSSLLFVLLSQLSAAFSEAIADSAVRFVCTNFLANALDRVRHYLKYCMIWLLAASAALSALLYLVSGPIFSLVADCLPGESAALNGRVGVFSEASSAALVGFFASPYVFMVGIARFNNLRHGTLAMCAEAVVTLADALLLVLVYFTASGRNAMQVVLNAAVVKFIVGVVLFFSVKTDMLTALRDKQRGTPSAATAPVIRKSCDQSGAQSSNQSHVKDFLYLEGISGDGGTATPIQKASIEGRALEEVQVVLQTHTSLGPPGANQLSLLSNRKSRQEEGPPSLLYSARRYLVVDQSQGTSDGEQVHE